MSLSAEEHAKNFDLRHNDFVAYSDKIYEVYDAMREDGPFAYTDHPPLDSSSRGVWVATRYEDCYSILRDHKHFSKGDLTGNATSEVQPGSQGNLIGSVILIDPPRQQKLRKLLNPYLSPSFLAQFEQGIRDTTDDLIDNIVELGEGDLAEVAWKQPSTVLFRYILGMPLEDVPFYLDTHDTAASDQDPEVRLAAQAIFDERVIDYVKWRLEQPPRGDVMDVLLGASIDGEELTFHEKVANIILLVEAGLDTTSSAMSFAFFYLATHPGDRDLLAAQPGLIPGAVEEFIRFNGSVHGIDYAVAAEVEISGHKLCPGERVTVNYAAANHDPREFESPDRCIVNRSINRHLGFGAGAHRCVGSHLARLEMKVGLEQALSRLKRFSLSVNELDYRGNAVVRGFRHLPVRFTPGERLSPG